MGDVASRLLPLKDPVPRSLMASVSNRFSISRAVEEVYFIKNKALGSYMGWHGVGMSMAAKAVAEAVKESKLFDVVVLVRAGEKCSPRKLQRRIAKQLDIIHDDNDSDDDEEEGIDKEVGRMIYRSLGGSSFLLIIDNLLQAGEGIIMLVSMGVPPPQQWSKYFITTPNSEVISAMNSDSVAILSAPQFEEAPPPTFPVKADIWNIRGVKELLEHFRDEAVDVADAVSNNNAIGALHVQVSREEVFNCFIYLCLLQKQEANEKELMKYYVGEGLIRSLLQDGKEMEHLEATFKVGQALLGEMVSRFMVQRSSPDDDGKFSVNSHLWKILERKEGIDCLKQRHHIQLEAIHVLEHDAKWMSLPNINNIQTFLLQQYKNPQLTTLLLNDNPQLAEIPDNFFLGIPNLKVLDLSRTSISSLPPSLSSLVHLRFLKLRECSSLNSLPPALLKALKRLIILDLHGTPLSTIPTEAFEQMPDLRLLDLSNTNIHSFPSSLLSSLRNLEQLFLSGCGSLGVSLPALQRQLSALAELDVSGCGALKDVENVCFEDMPKLRAVNLSNTGIARLSVTRCRSLEIVRLQGLANLKFLHLSSVKIKEFPCEISETKSLEQLRLTDVQRLERVDWEKVRWLPEKLEWDQCGCSTASALRPEEQAENRASSAFISVSNANIFRGLARDSPIWENCFSKFHIYICPCGKQKEKKEKEKAAVVDVGRRKMPRVYAGIHSRINGNFEKEVEGLSRHLEIEGVAGVYSEINRNFEKAVEGLSRYLEMEGVDGVLDRDVRSSIRTVAGKAEVLLLRENGFVKSLSTDFGVERREVAIKECRVERCHNMGHLFPPDMYHHIEGLKGRLWVSDMGTLWRVYDGGYSFTHLKHLHIQCCPRLIKLFGGETPLPTLETLHVRFCARLEQVHEYYRGHWAFPKLRIAHLWELPKLKGFCNWHHPLPPRLGKLRVRACPKLQRLPAIHGRVTIEGESDWWTNLNWDNQWNIKKEAIKFRSSNANDP